MSASDDIEAIWRIYQTTLDCFKVASRSISRNDLRLLNKTEFIEYTEDEASKKIKICQNDADDFVIVSLWASFERSLFLYLTTDIVNLQSKLFTERVADHIERLKLSDVLDSFKKVGIDSNLIGQAKQIYDYRNWIAHRNAKKTPSANVTPDMAYATLKEITRQLDGIISLSDE